MSATKRVLVPVAEGFEEIEAVTVIDILRRAGAEVIVAGLKPGHVRASRGVVLVPDTTLEAVQDQPFDMVVLPGGMPGAKHLSEDERVASILRRMATTERWIAAICAAPAVVLERSGFLIDHKATCHPNFRKDLENYVEDRVVIDGRVVTSQAPGTAMEFALTLVEVLLGPAKAEEVEKPLVSHPRGK